MVFVLPPSLSNVASGDGPAIRALRKYFLTPHGHPDFFAGFLFDAWDPSGHRAQDRHRFTADDLVSVTLLSVSVPPIAANELLVRQRDEFAELLVELGDDRDLVELEETPAGWAGWRLMDSLRSLPGVGPTTASKLLARKRPRLRPIYDSVVALVTGTTDQQWEPLRQALREDDQSLHDRLVRLREEAGLPDHISALRVLDVVAWMDGKGY